MCCVVNVYLKEVQVVIDLVVVYLINMIGFMIVVSNWDLLILFVGQNYVFCLYFVEVMCEGLGCFYGVGNIIGEMGYFVVVFVCEDNKLIGVVVVKVNFDVFEVMLLCSGDMVLFVDWYGVIFLLFVFEWKYCIFGILSVDQCVVFDVMCQYVFYNFMLFGMCDG